ncbi:MAG TPA: hypothetical protein VGB85_29710 [Nannocystis sp.]
MPDSPALDAAPRRGVVQFTRATGLALPVVAFVVAETLAAFAGIIRDYLAIHYDLWFELGMVIGQVLFQWAVLWRRTWTERLDYAVILVFVSGLGAALLWPLLLWDRAAPVEPLAAVAYFFAVVAVMFVVHLRLVRQAGLPLVLCMTWVIYRLLILAVVLPR